MRRLSSCSFKHYKLAPPATIVSISQPLQLSELQSSIMASSPSSSLLLFVAMVMVMGLAALAEAEQMGIMSIHNGFPSKLYVECNSDREQQPVDMVWAQEAHRFMFNADADRFWTCLIKTTPMTEFPYTLVPAVWGRFTLYTRHPTFRACYPACAWKVDADGVKLIFIAGDEPTLVYHWSKQ